MKVSERRPIFPQQAMIEEREKEGQRAPLWNPVREGREISVPNVVEDAASVAGQISESPQDSPSILRKTLGRYLSSGPDITKPVPLTHNRFRRVR